MSSSIPDISAIYLTRTPFPASSTEVLTDWTVEEGLSSSVPQSAHSHFNAQAGIYIVPKDGLYLLNVQLIPIGGATLANARKTRKQVNYALHIEDPGGDNHYYDIGNHNLGEIYHLRARAMLRCVRITGASGFDCLRLKISCIQRKRKRDEKVVSKKMKRKRRIARRTGRFQQEGPHKDTEGPTDTEWERGFDSDSTHGEPPISERSVDRLARI